MSSHGRHCGYDLSHCLDKDEHKRLDAESRTFRLNSVYEGQRYKQIDKLADCFDEQAVFMNMLVEDGRFPVWPIDLSTKENQRVLQGILWDTVREISEASACLKNRIHRVKEENFERSEFIEEMADAFAFFMESLLTAGFTFEDLYRQYMKKMEKVREGLLTGTR